MQHKHFTKTTLCLTVALSIALTTLFFITAASSTPAALASDKTSGPAAVSSRSVTVVGEGVVNIEPDIATATIGVEVLEATVKEASSAAQETMAQVKAALLVQNIREADIQTSNYRIYAERFGPEGPLPDDQVRYSVDNTVFITIRDLDSIGDVLDAAIDAGANNIYGVNFRIENPAAVESKARAMAIADARAKAGELADLNGLSVAGVLEISEIIGQGGGFFNSNFAQMGSDMEGGFGPFSPGELTLAMQLQITYDLE